MSQTPINTNPGILIVNNREFNNTNIYITLINMDDNSNNPYELKEDAYFTLTIKKGIETFFTGNLIGYECILYLDNVEISRFNPAALTDKIERTITFPKGTVTTNSTKILRCVFTFAKDGNSWTFSEQKERIDKMDFSGYGYINMQAINPINCNIIGDYFASNNIKIDNFYKFQIYSRLHTSWPMLLTKSYRKSECFNVSSNNISIGFHQNLDLIKYLISKNILWEFTSTDFAVKYYIKDNNGFKITYREYVEHKEIGKDYEAVNISNEQYWMTTGYYGGVRTGGLYYINNNVPMSNLEDLKFTLKGTINENHGVMPIDQIMSDNPGMDVNTQLIYTPRVDVADIFDKVIVDNGVYFCNDSVPIIVKFKEFLNLQYSTITLTVNNQKLSYTSDNNYTLMFYYPVKNNSSTQLKIEKIECNGQYIYGSKEINKIMPCTLVPIRMYDAIQDLQVGYITDCDNYKNKVNIKANLINGDLNYKDYYNNDTLSITDNTSKSVYATIIDKENNETLVDNVKLVYGKDPENNYYLSGSCEMKVNTGISDHKYGVQLYVRDRYSEHGTNVESDYAPLYGKTFDFLVNPIEFVEETDLTLIIPNNGPDNGKYWPSGEENVIYDTSKELVKVDYKYDGDATFASTKDFEWSIVSMDNKGDATIVNNEIELISAGNIKVKLTATNGNVEPDKNISVYSNIIEIIHKDDPTLIIPTSFSKVEIIDGSDATIRYIQNLTESFKDRDIQFNLNIYAGNYTMEALENEQPLHEIEFIRNSNSPDKNKYIIPSNLLTLGPSKENIPKYTILLKSANPYDKTEILSDIAYITVIAKQIKFDLNCGDKTTYIDNSDEPSKKTIINITWEIENIDEVNGADILFKVDKNGGVSLDSIKEFGDMIKQPNNKYTGSYNLEITNVDEHTPKDIYTISIKGKNLGNKEYSFDSRIINVYSASSMKILINNEDKKTYDMNNYDYISDLYLQKLNSDDIEKLRKELNLKANANIKSSTFNEYDDLLSWSTSDHNKLTINYFNGVNYQDIDKTIYKYFTPSKQFLLSGLQDGKVIVTATHAQTNRLDEVEINIESLKDKFYLFKFNPKCKTTLNYTDSKNNKRSVTSNDEGMLALYEPNSINSDIYVKSEYINEVYLGTILKISLLSGEKDVTINALYPINYFNLRKVAVIDINMKKEDGSPYNEKVKIYGGVYKNGGYCQNALINNKDGKVGIEVQVDNNGHTRLNLDSTQFWSKDLGEDEYVELIPSDKLKFILEIYPSNSTYYPTIIYLDGNESLDNIARFGEGIVNLRKIKDNKTNNPFIVNQSILYPDSNISRMLTDDITKVGPSDKHLQINLNTDVMMWGTNIDEAATYKLLCKDKNKNSQIVQSSNVIKYPFSKFILIRNTVNLSEDAIWIDKLKKTTIQFDLYDKNNLITKSLIKPVQLVNMCGIEAVEQSSEVTSQLEKLKETTSISGTKKDMGDKLIQVGLDIISAIGMQGQFFKMAISSTQDPSIYRVFIWAGNTDAGLNIPDNLSIVVLDELEGRGLGVVPEIGDLVSMAKGTYMKEQQDTLNNNLNSTKKTSSQTDFSVGLGGYFLGEIDFDYDITKWDFCLLSGGFTATASMEYKWTYNTQVGPIPVTAYIKFGGGIGANFNVAVRRSQLPAYPWAGNYPSKKANDYITRINANVYIRAFVGIGFDYSIIALRIGIFGQVDVSFETAFLSRNYLSDTSLRELNGQYLGLLGTIGIEFAVTILFISYEKVLASKSWGKNFYFNDWDKIDDYWNENSSVFANDDFENKDLSLQEVSSKRLIERRSYLENYERFWASSSDFALLSNNNISILQQNAYPGSNPRLSNDGSILIYLSDRNSTNISDTRLCYSIRNEEGKFDPGIVIPPSTSNTQVVFDGFGDSNPKIDGNKDFAVATWIRLREQVNLTEGSELSDYDQLAMLNSSEIMLSIYKNSLWHTIRVTEDTTPDLAPVVTINGDSLLLAWRNVYCNNDTNPLDFTTKDNIDFVRINKDNLEINETHNLYNGSNGIVKGMDVAMLKDGTCLVAYVLDLSNNNLSSEHEIFYSIISPNNEIIKTVRLTNDEYLNDNPKVSTVTITEGRVEIEKFVIAYHTVKESEENILNDIKVSFIDREGNIDVSAMEAISEKAGEDKVEISENFEFVKVNKQENNLENLALMWTEAYLSIDEAGKQNTDKDVLKVVKFMEDINERISISAPMEVGVMEERTLVDAFDCYMDPSNNFKINGVLLGNNYSKINLEDPSTYKEVITEQGLVYVSTFVSNLYMLNSNLENSINVENMYVDFTTVKANMPILVLVTLENKGMDIITKITIELNEKSYDFENLLLNPNEKIELSLVYEIGEEINNIPITITGKTINNETITEYETLYLDYPDVGISKTEIISEENGIRSVRVTLYNGSDCSLAKANRSVVLGLYEDSEFTKPMTYIKFRNNDENTPLQNQLIINNMEDLKAIDNGYYTTVFDFNIKDYLGQDVEIPDGNLQINIKTEIKETINNMEYVLPEINLNNNTSYGVFESLLNKNAQKLNISIDHNILNNHSQGDIGVKNNSLKKLNGRLLAKLLDENENVIESRVIDRDDLTTFSSSKLLLNEEEELRKNIDFDKHGKSIVVEYNDDEPVKPDINETTVTLTYDFDEVPRKIKITFTVYGAGMDNDDPIEGDIRWKPFSYSVMRESGKGVFECEEYKEDMYFCYQCNNVTTEFADDYSEDIYVNRNGKYMIYVTLEKEEYRDNKWISLGIKNTLEYNFIVENR